MPCLLQVLAVCVVPGSGCAVDFMGCGCDNQSALPGVRDTACSTTLPALLAPACACFVFASTV